MKQYPLLTQFGQTNLDKVHLSLYYNNDCVYVCLSMLLGNLIDWGTPLGVPQYWFDQTWGTWAIIEDPNFFFINR